MRRGLFLLVVAIIATPLWGGVVTLDLAFPDDPEVAEHEWLFDYGSSVLSLTEVYKLDAKDRVIFTGTTDSDPMIHISKEITNDNAVAWTSYELSLDESGDAVFDYTVTPTSNWYTVVDTSDTMNLTFSAPVAVPVGETVTLDFDINIPTTEWFGFTLTQRAIPEPTTICLLGLGGLALLRKRRR